MSAAKSSGLWRVGKLLAQYGLLKVEQVINYIWYTKTKSSIVPYKKLLTFLHTRFGRASFVSSKDNNQWIWLGIDTSTKEIVGVYIGKRDQGGAQELWDSLPPVYRQCAVSYTDFCPFLWNCFSWKKQKAVGKDTGKTNYIERFKI